MILVPYNSFYLLLLLRLNYIRFTRPFTKHLELKKVSYCGGILVIIFYVKNFSSLQAFSQKFTMAQLSVIKKMDCIEKIAENVLTPGDDILLVPTAPLGRIEVEAQARGPMGSLPSQTLFFVPIAVSG